MHMTRSLLTLAATSLCAWGAAAPATTTPVARPMHMVGTVKNAQGRPLAGVRVGADNTVIDGSEVWTTTDAQGRYDLDLSRMPILNSWTATAQLDVTYHGQRYTLFPEVDHPAAFLGKSGAVRNFTLRLVGPSRNGGLYGALLYANLGLSEAGEAPEFSDVEFRLVPDGPLVDGTPGKAFTLRWAQLPFELPLGRYTVTARSLSGRGAIWLKAGGGAYAPSATLDPRSTAGTGMTLSVDLVHPRR